jgi:hypothetical protein
MGYGIRHPATNLTYWGTGNPGPDRMEGLDSATTFIAVPSLLWTQIPEN